MDNKKIGEITRKVSGGRFFQYDPETGILSKMDFPLVTKPGCLYIEAINMKNAEKKFNKGLFRFAVPKKQQQ